MNILLLMMGGRGERFGAQTPKQYIKIDGKPLFIYIVSGYSQIPDIISEIIIVSHKDWTDYVGQHMNSLDIKIPWLVAEGGSNRSESVLNGLKKAMEHGKDTDVVLIHDATHPYVDIEGTRAVIQAVKEYGGATLGGAEFDTMYQMDTEGFIENVIPRQFVVSGASPEAFRLGEIYRIYMNSSLEELNRMTSAGAIALAHQIRMKVIPSKYMNLKITHPGDMELFRYLRKGYFFD